MIPRRVPGRIPGRIPERIPGIPWYLFFAVPWLPVKFSLVTRKISKVTS